ncbi:hypothetical protein DIPPA_18742 [Diplonema papillatum]|nr:hypothetical protein DIPPA_18742 [Diplonema papillatum]
MTAKICPKSAFVPQYESQASSAASTPRTPRPMATSSAPKGTMEAPPPPAMGRGTGKKRKGSSGEAQVSVAERTEAAIADAQKESVAVAKAVALEEAQKAQAAAQKAQQVAEKRAAELALRLEQVERGAQRGLSTQAAEVAAHRQGLEAASAHAGEVAAAIGEIRQEMQAMRLEMQQVKQQQQQRQQQQQHQQQQQQQQQHQQRQQQPDHHNPGMEQQTTTAENEALRAQVAALQRLLSSRGEEAPQHPADACMAPPETEEPSRPAYQMRSTYLVVGDYRLWSTEVARLPLVEVRRVLDERFEPLKALEGDRAQLRHFVGVLEECYTHFADAMTAGVAGHWMSNAAVRTVKTTLQRLEALLYGRQAEIPAGAISRYEEAVFGEGVPEQTREFRREADRKAREKPRKTEPKTGDPPTGTWRQRTSSPRPGKGFKGGKGSKGGK